MQIVRFYFYRAKLDIGGVLFKKRKLHLIDDGISWWTWLFNPWTPPYSHQETGAKVDGVEWLWTSTMRGEDNGTVSRPASTVFKYPKRWEYIEFEVTDESFEAAKAWADERVKNNKGYSKRDLLRFAMPLWMLKKLKIADPDREICSEHGEGWATRLLVLAKPYGVTVIHKFILQRILIRSPRRLWRDLTKRHKVATYSLATGLMVRDEKGRKV